MIAITLKLLLAYLVGSVSGGLVLGRLRGVDIRSMGSGNAGGTNALRTQGAWFALGVVAIDIGKGVLAVLLVARLPPATSLVSLPALQAACGIMAIVGHIWPVWHGFRGGKGAATFAGAAAAMLPVGLVPVLLIWMLVVVATGYVGLATMIAAVAFIPLAALLCQPGAEAVLVPFGVAAAALIVFAHRGNIRRMLAGNENRFDKIRFQRWFR